MLPVIIRISDLVQVAADHGLGLLRFGPNHGVQAFAPFADVGVATKEIHRARPESEELRHPGVVVIVLGEMAVSATLCRADTAGGVREMRIEGLATVT